MAAAFAVEQTCVASALVCLAVAVISAAGVCYFLAYALVIVGAEQLYRACWRVAVKQASLKNYRVADLEGGAVQG